MTDPGTTRRTCDEVQKMCGTQDPIHGLQKYVEDWGLAAEEELKAIDKEKTNQCLRSTHSVLLLEFCAHSIMQGYLIKPSNGKVFALRCKWLVIFIANNCIVYPPSHETAAAKPGRACI